MASLAKDEFSEIRILRLGKNKINRSGEKLDRKKSENMGELLNPAQKKSLQTALRLLEEKLYAARLLMDGGSYQGILYDLKIDVDERQKRKCQSLFEEIISVIREIEKQFNLSKTSVNFSHHLNGIAHYFRSVLLDETATALKRYGPVAAELEGTLDPLIFDLVQRLADLTRVFQEMEKSGKGQ